MASKQEMIEAVLDELESATTDIQGLAVISPDGMMISNKLGSDSGDAAAAMGAAMGSLGKRVADTLKVGNLEEINIRGSGANILVFDIESRASLLLQVKSDANLGLVLLEARSSQQKLSKIV